MPEPLIDLAPAPTSLSIEPLTPAIGAVVAGVDLARPLRDAEVHELRTAVHRHHVVFVRGQHLAVPDHERLAAQLGVPAVSPLHRLLGTGRTVSTIVDDAEHPPAGFPWHTDLSWLAAPPSMGILHAVDVPPVGGDTLWASLPAAFLRLSAAEQAQCRDLGARHVIDATLLRSIEGHHGPEVALALRRAHPPVTHPLVRPHPVTGAPLLFLCPLSVERLVGIDHRAGDRLLHQLHGMLDDPHVQVRWRWQTGDVAIWDEASTCHRALADHSPQRRVMRRCVLEGDVTVA